MARGDKSKYTDKQKRQAEHIEEGYEERGLSEGEAEKRAWATVNNQKARRPGSREVDPRTGTRGATRSTAKRASPPKRTRRAASSRRGASED